MRQTILKGFLWCVVCTSLIFTFLGFGFCLADGKTGYAFAYLTLLVPFILAGVPLYRMRKVNEQGKTAGDYERKLREWEAEGYDVSELREKWFPAKKAKGGGHKGRWFITILAIIFVAAGGIFVWQALPKGNSPQPTKLTETVPAPVPIYALMVSVNPSEGGKVSPDGGSYKSGETVTISAIPSEGYKFSGWSGDVSRTEQAVTITMDSDKKVQANFAVLSSEEEKKPVVVPSPQVLNSEIPEYEGIASIVLSSDIHGFDEASTYFLYTDTLRLTNEELLQGDWAKGPADSNEADWVLGDINRMDMKTGSLAESWEIPGSGKLILHIRPLVYWHNKPPTNGREMDAYDVVYSLKRLCAGSESYIKQAYPSVAENSDFLALDKYTVQIDTPTEEFGTALTLFTDCASIMPPEVIEMYGDMKDWKNSCGTGPFMLTNYIANSSATLEKNPSYWGADPVGTGKDNPLPYLDEVRMLIIPDKSTRLAAFRTGKVDNLIGLGLEDAEQMMKTTPALEHKNYIQDSCYSIYMRTDRTGWPFSDIKVRQALMMAIDHQQIKDKYYGGEAEILVWPIIDTREYADAYVSLEELPANVQELYVHNLTRAKELLAEAGYPDGFKTEISCSSDQEQMDFLSVVKNMWSEIGIDLEIKVYEPGVWRSNFLSRTYEQMIFGNNSGIGNYYELTDLRGSSAGRNGSYINNAQVEETYKKMQPYIGINEANIDKLYRDLMPYVLEQAWVISRPNPYIYNMWWPWLKNYHGELSVGYYNSHNYLKYVWLDQDVKEQMGY
jgi:peptide/nickel transport system substrate-binding protein